MIRNKYPRGKLKDDDEGELIMAMTVVDKTLVIDFGKPVKWIGLPFNQALELAQLIVERVTNADT